MKDVVFIDTALDDLWAFPPAVRRETGYQIDLVQQGFDPSDWKPKTSKRDIDLARKRYRMLGNARKHQ